MRRFGFIALLGILLGASVDAAQVGLIKINGAIGPATANYIARALDTAAAQHDECLIIQLDTPGGFAAGPTPQRAMYQSAVQWTVWRRPRRSAHSTSSLLSSTSRH